MPPPEPTQRRLPWAKISLNRPATAGIVIDSNLHQLEPLRLKGPGKVTSGRVTWTLMLDRKRHLSRRDFLTRAVATASTLALSRGGLLSTPGSAAIPIVVFSKVYQELKLGFAEAAEATAEAGLDGVDCPLRAGGEIAPERAAAELPRYMEALRARGLQLPLLTTDITSVSSPKAEEILRTAKKLGIHYYRVGFIYRQKDAAQQMSEVRTRLKELAALNRQIGICGLLQNHSPDARNIYFGGDLGELSQAVDGFAPDQIGVAFDIAHALVVHGPAWRSYFERLKPHFKIAYVKDVQLPRNWVPFGQGALAGSGYFELLRQMHYQAPVSLHVEFDWTDQSKAKTRTGLVRALQSSGRVLRGWLG